MKLYARDSKLAIIHVYLRRASSRHRARPRERSVCLTRYHPVPLYPATTSIDLPGTNRSLSPKNSAFPSYAMQHARNHLGTRIRGPDYSKVSVFFSSKASFPSSFSLSPLPPPPPYFSENTRARLGPTTREMTRACERTRLFCTAFMMRTTNFNDGEATLYSRTLETLRVTSLT